MTDETPVDDSSKDPYDWTEKTKPKEELEKEKPEDKKEEPEKKKGKLPPPTHPLLKINPDTMNYRELQTELARQELRKQISQIQQVGIDNGFYNGIFGWFFGIIVQINRIEHGGGPARTLSQMIQNGKAQWIKYATPIVFLLLTIGYYFVPSNPLITVSQTIFNLGVIIALTLSFFTLRFFLQGKWAGLILYSVVFYAISTGIPKSFSEGPTEPFYNFIIAGLLVIYGIIVSDLHKDTKLAVKLFFSVVIREGIKIIFLKPEYF